MGTKPMVTKSQTKTSAERKSPANVRVSSEVMEQVEALAKKHGLSRKAIIDIAIKKYLRFIGEHGDPLDFELE